MNKNRLLLFFSGLLGLAFSFSIECANSAGFALTFDQEGRIVVVGQTNNIDNNSLDIAIARYHPDGSLDISFNPTGSQPGTLTFGTPTRDESARAVVIDEENRIVVVGTSSTSLNDQWEIVRFNEDGSLDTTFNSGGLNSNQPGVVLLQIETFDTARSVVLDSLGRIIVAGTTNDGILTEAAVARFTEAGILDTTFGGNNGGRAGIFQFILDSNMSEANGIAITADDELYIAGSFNNTLITQFLVFKLTLDGVLDTTFTGVDSPPGTAILSIQGINDSAFAIEIDSSGRIVAGGQSNALVGFSEFALVRYLPSGALDTSFNPTPTTSGIVITQVGTRSSAIASLAFDSLNAIVVTGVSSALNGTINQDISTTVRYTESGLLDTTFGIGGIVTTGIPTSVETFTNPGGAGTGIIVGPDDILYTSGFSFDGVQDNFTTISYLSSGALNPVFNPVNPGIVITVFGNAVQLGNGIPYVVPDVATISPTILENVFYPVIPVEPTIDIKSPLITNDYQPYLRGTATPQSIVRIYLNDIPIFSVLAGFKGDWEAVLPPLQDGTYVVTASALNPFTGLSLSSLPLTLTISTEPPPPPAILNPFPGQKFLNDSIVVSGKSGPSQDITVFIDKAPRGMVRATKAGVWSLPVGPLPSGEHIVSAVATDQAGNTSPLAQEIPFILSSRLPVAPRILSPKNAALLKDARVRVSGDAPSGSSVNVFVNDRLEKTVKASAQGLWSLDLPPLNNGLYRIRAASLDGKRSSETVSITVSLPESQSPQAAIVLKNGYIQGRASPGSIITLFEGERQLGRVVANPYGIWSYGPLAKEGPKAPTALSISIADKTGAIRSVVKQTVVL